MADFPWFNMQQINLDWLLEKIKSMLPFLPNNGTVGQILRRTATGAVWSDEVTGSGLVDSVNGMTGDVVLGKANVGLGNVADKDLSNVDNVRQYSADNPPPYPVKSVNGQTGDVTVQPATDAQVTTAVNTWLGENVAQETGYVLDSSLTMSNAAPPASAVGDLKSDLIEDLESYLDDIADGFVSTEIGHKVYISTSTKTKTYVNMIWVRKGKVYTVEIVNSSTPAATSIRNSAVVTDGIVSQVIGPYTAPAGQTTKVVFTAENDGYLWLSCDVNTVRVSAYGCKFYEDIHVLQEKGDRQQEEINHIKDDYFLEGSLTFDSAKSLTVPQEVTFKANHTYVISVDSDLSGYGNLVGISNTNYRYEMYFTDGKEVAKFKIGNSDIVSRLWFYVATANKTINYIVEEWSERDVEKLYRPGTIVVSAHDSDPNDKYISQYNCDGSDDQVEIQNAIDNLPITGGKVVLCDGNYYISSLRDSGNSEIGLIGIEIKDPERYHSVSIEGVGKPIRVGTRKVGLGATIFLSQAASSTIGTNQHCTIIGALPVDNELMRVARALNLTVKNIGINIPDNTKAVRCIDAEYCSALEIENVCIGMSTDSGDITNPNADCIGIRGLGGWNYGIYYTIKDVKVFGMGVAFDLGGEHLVMEQCAVRYSNIPYRFYAYGDVSKMAHSQTMINCTEEFCMSSFVFFPNSKKPNISIIDHNIEWRYDEWGRTQKAIEVHPGDIRGNVSFSIDHIDYENTSDAQFWEAGSGLNVKTINRTDLFMGTTSERPPYPNRAQQYFDTTINKLLVYNGTNWAEI